MSLCCVGTLLSAVPAVADSDVKNLPQPVQQALERFNLDGSGLSVHIQKIGSASPLLTFNNEQPRNPASAIKLLTTLVALEQLGPAYTWKTDFFTDQEVIDGTLNGDLWVRGGGDPYLPLERIWLAVRQLRASGLTTINGDLIIDQSMFATIDEDPGDFDERPLRAYNVVPSALVSNFNVAQMTFTPNPDNGSVDLKIAPPLPMLKIDNALQLVDKRCSGYQRGIEMHPNGHNGIQLQGTFPTRCKRYSMGRSIANKNAFTAELFRQLWLESGGHWLGSWQLGELNEDDESVKRILRFPSLSLAEVVRSINKYSNNLMSRMVFLTLGVDAYEAPGDFDKSYKAIRDWLEQRQLDLPELVIANGAGSARNTRISARGLAELLQRGWASRYMPEFVASMSLSGQDGTFRRRHRSGPLHGQIHAKTGRIDHVISLAGYYQSKQGDRYAIAMLHNAENVHRGSGHVVQDSILKWLSETVN